MWGMDKQDETIMLHQCESGTVLSDGSRLSPDEAWGFWLSEALRLT